LKLETQLDRLAELGLAFNPGITIEDLLYAYERQAFEQQPFVLLLFCFGAEVEREPWGRRICDRVWNFDTECIASTGDYVKILHNLCLLSQTLDYLTDIVDYIDLEEGECWLEYTIQEKRQHRRVEANDDWADMLTLSDVMEELQRDGQQFYTIDNGQAMILLYCTPAIASKLGDLCDEDLEPIIPA